MRLWLWIAGLLMAVPVAASLAIAGLSSLLSCTGTDHIASCAVPGGATFLNTLLVFAYSGVVTLPLGIVLLLILGIVSALRK